MQKWKLYSKIYVKNVEEIGPSLVWIKRCFAGADHKIQKKAVLWDDPMYVDKRQAYRRESMDALYS